MNHYTSRNLSMKTDKFLENCLPKLKQKEAENLNRLITMNEIKAVIKKLTVHKNPRSDGITGERRAKISFSNYSKKFRSKEYFQTLSMSPVLSSFQNKVKKQ